jgi:hypothetical protein
MIRRIVVALMVSGFCFSAQAEAADLPLTVQHRPVKKAEAKVVVRDKRKITVSKPRPVRVVPKIADRLDEPQVAPVEKDVEVAVQIPKEEKPQVKSPEVAPVGQELELSWFLNSLIANVDGPKNESSASMEGNLIVAEPGYVTSPYMVIELSGHVVKTPATTVRIDVSVGKTTRSVTWPSDDTKSGRFKVAIDAPLAKGKLPGYFPVSAIAFVTREGKSGTAMVSLDKVRLRVGKVTQVADQ